MQITIQFSHVTNHIFICECFFPIYLGKVLEKLKLIRKFVSLKYLSLILGETKYPTIKIKNK